MKYIFVNLKRFDVPKEKGGVNSISDVQSWGKNIVNAIYKGVAQYNDVCFTVFWPEAHIQSAASVKESGVNVGCQGVHFADVKPGGNFGAFTTSLPAAAAASLGCNWTIIGHCEERNKLTEILTAGGCTDMNAVNVILGREVKCAFEAGLNVLYCVGEKDFERKDGLTEEVLKRQLAVCNENQPPEGSGQKLVIGYEPVWAIGPGKTPPQADEINTVATYIKSVVNLPVVYGGGLKNENARMIGEIESVDGGLIALTRFAGEIGFYPEEFLEIVQKYVEIK